MSLTFKQVERALIFEPEDYEKLHRANDLEFHVSWSHYPEGVELFYSKANLIYVDVCTKNVWYPPTIETVQLNLPSNAIDANGKVNASVALPILYEFVRPPRGQEKTR